MSSNKGPKSNNDVLSSNTVEETFKISEIKDKFQIKVTTEELEKYGDKLLNLKEIQDIKEGNTTVAKLGLEKLRLSMDNTGESIKNFKEKFKPKEIKEKANNGLDQITKDLDEAYGNIKNSKTTSDINKNIQKGIEKSKDLGEKAIKSGYALQFGNAMKDAFESLKKGNIMDAIAIFFKGLFGNYGGETIKEKIKEKVSDKNLENTKLSVKEYINKNFGETLTQENKEKLNKRLDNLSKEELLKLEKKLEKGELTYSDIKDVIPNIFNKFLGKEQIEKIRKDAHKKMVESIVKEVKAKYNVDIQGDKLRDLEKLVKENTQISDESIGIFINAGEKEEIRISELFGPTYEGAINSSKIMLGLLSKQIVPIGAFGLEFADSTATVVKLSASAIGLTDSFPIDGFLKSIESMDSTEKAVLIGLLYRKGGLLLSLTSSLLATTSRLGIEFATGTSVKTYDTIKSSLKGDYLKQAENISKISKTLGVENFKDVNNALDDVIKKLDSLADNYKILDALEKSKGDSTKAIKNLKDAGIDIKGVSKDMPFEKIVTHYKDNASKVLTEFFSMPSAKSALLFGAEADIFKLKKKIENLSKAQRMMFSPNILSKGIGKLKEITNIGEISRLGDRVTLHFESVEDAKKGLSKWNVLANKFPDLVKGTLDKLPIIAIAGISANSDKGFFEEFKNQIPYLIPVVGPVMLISDSGFSWKNGKLEVINGVEASIGGALLALDGVFVTKELIKGGPRAAGSYMLKPIADLYNITRAGAEGAYSVGKAALDGKSFKSLIKNAAQRSEKLKMPSVAKKPLKKILIPGLILAVGAEMVFAEDMDDYFYENGKAKKKEIKENIEKFNDDEKEIFLKYLIAESFGEKYLNNIDIQIVDNKINIISKNPEVKGDWIIYDNMKSFLELDNEVNFKYERENA